MADIPDWALNVPSTQSVHTVPIIDSGANGPDTSGMLDACGGIFGGQAFTNGLMVSGAGAEGGPTGAVLQGTQNFANSLCGQAIGMPTLGTSPQTVVDGVSDTNNQVHDNPFVSGLIGMGGPQPNQILGMLCGLQTFLGMLCGMATGSNTVTSTTPQSVLNTTQAAADTGVFMLAGSYVEGSTGVDVMDAGQTALNQNTSNHVANQSLTTAQSVALKRENLLVSQDFSNSNNVAADPDGNWVHNADDGAVTMGCLQATANGTLLEYVSNEIPVVVGENIELSAYIRTIGLVYTGSDPVTVGVQKYRKGRANGGITYLDVGGYEVIPFTPDVGSATPAGAALPSALPMVLEPEPTDDSGWVDVAGIYVVQAGVDQLRFKFTVQPTATSGMVRFDEANFLKTDLIADDCVPGVGLTVDDIVTQLYGTAGEGFTHNESAVALGNTAASLASTSARVAALEAENVAGGGGAIAGDDFNWYGSILGSANWGGDQNGGEYYANGQDAEWTDSPYTVAEFFFDWQGTDAVSDTDYQVVQMVLGSAPTSDGGYGSSIYLYGRVNADWNSAVGAGIDSSGNWQVGYYSGGAWTTMRSGSRNVPGMGATLTLYLGDKVAGLPRHFKFTINNSTLADFNETGTGSPLGASNRKYGWGGDSGGGVDWFIFPHQGIPAAVAQWLGMDQ